MGNSIEFSNNLKSFREVFKDFSDCYTLIGGTACTILMEDAGLSFRATKDIDMILILEDKGPEFGKVFWDFILAGGYTCGWKEIEAHYYRFTKPKLGYPSMIELFSRQEDFTPSEKIIPVHISEDISSLSAIALDEDFYNFMLKGRKNIDDITILDAAYIIPFKMYAWLNNRDKRKEGQIVNTDDIKKHKNDIFRILPLINATDKIEVYGNVKKVIERFLNEMANEQIDEHFLTNGRSKKDSLSLLKDVYLTPNDTSK